MDINHAPSHHIPTGLDIAAAWSWRVLIVLGLVAVLAYGLSQVVILWIPLVVGGFVAGLLNPVINWLGHKGVKRVLATVVTFVAFIAGFSWLLAVVVEELVRGFGGIWVQVQIATGDLEAFVAAHRDRIPIALPALDLNQIGGEIARVIQENSSSLLGSVASLGSGASTAVTVVMISLFSAFFFMYQGKEIWAFMVSLAPKEAQGAIDAGGKRGWIGVVAYVRFQVAIAIMEGFWLGGTALLLGLPLAIPLGLFVMLGALIPILGALITGVVAILLAFATGGFFAAIVMTISVLGINQIETVVLQPWLMGRAVNLHPLAILLSVIGGAYVAGLVGALITVPLVAFNVAAITGIRRYLDHRASPPEPEPSHPAFVPYGY